MLFVISIALPFYMDYNYCVTCFQRQGDQMRLYKVSLRITSIAVFSLLLISASSHTAFADKTASDYTSDAEIDYTKGNFDSGIDECNQAIELDPNYYDAYEERGLLYLEKGEYDLAISDETKTIELSPDSILAYQLRGEAYGRQGNYYQDAIDQTSAIEKSPNYYDALAERGYSYYMQGNNDQALEDCNKAIWADPNDIWAYQVRGYIYGSQGNYAQEVADESTVIGLYPAARVPCSYAWQAHVARAQAYIKMGQYDNAWSDVHKAQSLGIEVPQDLIDSLNANSGSNNDSGGQQ